MNTFKVYILNIYTNIYQEVSLATMPFAFGNLLDERLDEANIVVYSSVEKYEPNTRVQVVINKDEADETTLFFDIANDRSHKLYPASTTYEHELYLIEITKELEGFVCQSLTFTSKLPYTSPEPLKTDLIYEFVSIEPFYYTLDDFNLKSRMLHSDTPLPSIGDVAYDFNALIVQKTSTNYYVVSDYSDNLCKITVNGVSTDYTNFDTQPPMPNESFDIRYVFAITNDASYFPTTYEFDYTFHIDVVETLSPQSPYTITDCVKRVLSLAEPIRSSSSPRFGMNVDDDLKYEKILAPDFTMTKCTLREQLKVIGGFIHCEPRLLDNNTIKFDPLGLGNEATISNDPYVDETISWSINEYNTAIETNASNIVNTLNKDEATLYDSNAFNTRTIRTDVYSLLSDTETSFIKTALPIQEIYKVYCVPYNADGTSWNNVGLVDITKYVCEKHDYDRMSSFRGTYPNAKAYALYYTKGEQGIRGLFFKANTILEDISVYLNHFAIVNILEAETKKDFNTDIDTKFPYLSFRVEYLPIYSAMFSHSKQYISPTDIGKKKPFYKPYAQSENMIESSYYGENIKGVAQRMGNPEKTCTFVMKDLTNIPSVGQMFKGYAISGVNVEVLPNVITCSLALTKDFNRISQYIGITSNKRVYEVSELEAYARNILLREYIIVYPTYRGNGVYNQINNESDSLLLNQDAIRYTFDRTGTHDNLLKPISACVGSRCKKGDPNTRVNKTILPVISSAFGNVASFSWQYKDNYSAGESVGSEADEHSHNAFYSADVPYVDYYGRVYWYNFDLYNDLFNGGKTQAMTDALVNSTLEQYVGIPPVLTTKSSVVSTNTKPYLCMKDNREILGFNYQLEFISADENIFIGSAMAKEFTLVSGYKKHTNGNPTKLICYVMDTPISKFAHKIDPTGLSTIELDENHYNDDNDYEYGFWLTVSSANDGKYFCIATQPKPVTKTYDDNGTTESITTEQGNDIVLWGKLRRNPNSYRMKFKFAIKRTIYK